ncbi:anti-sigma factor [Jiella sp. M17.18]|uniref:anti-sigma factor n=1 Tax=Jiella sp. M17.18 TaxID=3234247 RepID=UPI0034E01123
MSDPRDHEGGEGDLAAEYVLGLLDGSARRSAERRAERDPAFAAEIAAWAERLGPLATAIPDAEPPADLWPRIAGDLDRMTRRPPGEAEEVRRPRGRRVAGIWQWIGLAGMGLAAASLAALIVVSAGLGNLGAGAPAGRSLTFTATLSSSSGAPLATVVIDPANATATLIPVANPDTGGRVPELWLVPPGGGSPRSLGLIDMSKPLRLQVKASGVTAPNAALAVSMEPPGGSPTGLPTGPVVASGALHSV